MPSAPLSESLLSSGADVGGLVLCGRSALSISSKVCRDERRFAQGRVARGLFSQELRGVSHAASLHARYVERYVEHA